MAICWCQAERRTNLLSDTPKSIKIEQKALSAKQICEHKPRPSRGGGGGGWAGEVPYLNYAHMCRCQGCGFLG